MLLITKAQRAKLLANGRHIAKTGDDDLSPIVKLFTPDANCTWLLVSMEPDDPDIAYGLCDLGLGAPEIGSVRMSELKSVRGRFGLPIERDRFFDANGKKLSVFAREARERGFIQV